MLHQRGHTPDSTNKAAKYHKKAPKIPAAKYHKKAPKIPQTCFSIFHTKHMFLKFHKKAQRLPTSQAQHYKHRHKQQQSNLKQQVSFS